MADRVVSVELKAKVDGAVAGFQKAKAAVDDLTKAASPSKQDAFRKLSDKAAIAGVGIATAMGLAVKRFADFDQSMSAVQANSGATGAELEKLRGLAVKLGADSQFSAKEAADGINEMAKAGVAVQDVMGGGLKGALDLAAAGQIGVADAAETAATAMTQFKLSGDKVPHIADLLANAANKAQGGVGDMAQALKQAGLVASSTGLSIEETTAGLTAFASAGLIGSDAGTSFKTMLQRLSAPSGDAAQAMADLGISAYDSSGQFVGLANVAGQLQSSLSKLTPAQRQAALATIFGSDAVRAANVLYEQGATGINKWIDAVNEQGAAAKQAAALTDNLNGDIERLGGALDSVFIQTGSGANDGLRTLVQQMTVFVDSVGKIPGPVLLAGGALTSFALLAPKGVIKWREYKGQLDSLGISLDKISTKAPRTGAALDKISASAKSLSTVLAAASAVDVFFLSDDQGVGVQTLTQQLTGATNAADAFNKVIVDLDTGSDGLNDTLKTALDPSVLDKFQKSGNDLTRTLTGGLLDLGEPLGIAEERIGELDQVLSGLVQSGNADSAAKIFGDIAARAKAQGESVDDLKAKLPGYTEALAGVANQSSTTSQSQKGVSENLEKVKTNAENARKAVDEYIQSMQDAGLVVLDSRAANRQFEQSLDDVTERLNKRKEVQKELDDAQKASADTNNDGKVSADETKAKADNIAKLKDELAGLAAGFDVNTQAGRDNQAALDNVAKSALDLAQARFDEKAQTGDLDGAEKAYRDSLLDSRSALVKTGIQMGLTKAEATKYADEILKIPPVKTTKVTIQTVGFDSLKAVGNYLAGLQDKKVTLTVGTIRLADGTKVNAGQFATGGYTGDGGTYEPAGIVHRGEYVLRKAVVPQIGKATLDYLNRHGRLPGYAGGGMVGAPAARPVPISLTPSASSELTRLFLSGSLNLGDGLTGHIRAIAQDVMRTGPRNRSLAAQNG